jgi:hypothetical protein
MKKTLFFAVLLFFAIGLNRLAFAQSTTTMQDLLETVNKKVVELEETQNQEVVNITLDLLVNTGKKVVWRSLDPSFAYNVSVIGDRRISKLKISVYKKGASDWEYVDELTDSKPTLRVEPTDFIQYQFTVSVDTFKPGDNVGHFALLLYHKNPERDK